MDSDGGSMHLGNCVGEVLEQREVCRAFAKAPRVPVAGTSTVSTSTGKSQLDLLFLDDSIALRDIDVLPKYSLLIPVLSENPKGVSEAFCKCVDWGSWPPEVHPD